MILQPQKTFYRQVVNETQENGEFVQLLPHTRNKQTNTTIKPADLLSVTSPLPRKSGPSVQRVASVKSLRKSLYGIHHWSKSLVGMSNLSLSSGCTSFHTSELCVGAWVCAYVVCVCVHVCVYVCMCIYLWMYTFNVLCSTYEFH